MGIEAYEGYRALCEPHERISEHDALIFLKDQYRLSNITLRRIMTERDDTFSVSVAQSTRPKWILKIEHPSESREAVLMRAQAIRSFEELDSSLPVTRIFANRSDALVSAMERQNHTRYATLTSFVAGEMLSHMREPASDLLLFNMGKALARIELVLAKQQSCEDHLGRVLWDMRLFPEICEATLPAISDIHMRKPIERALDDYLTIHKRVCELPEYMCHGDFHPGNVMVDSNMPNVIAGIIDFGDMHRMPLICDVATCLCYAIATHARVDTALAPCRRILQGYSWQLSAHDDDQRRYARSTSLMHLSDEDYSLLPILIEVRSALAVILPYLAQTLAGVDASHYIANPETRLRRLITVQNIGHRECEAQLQP
ncbi:phosphotransferase [Bifidobacterium aquikefiri]|uniref:phosphotransferase n=1 Tax=Bifidobacterium aquikefiri TaxID=1653207 RepID=UPI0023F13A6F|nr:phosphotransferase [Bifidobacterium aquikefiri]